MAAPKKKAKRPVSASRKQPAKAKSNAKTKTKTKTKAKTKTQAKTKRRDPRDVITIGITPPQLAPESEACALHNRIGNRETRPEPHALAELPWFAQDRAYRAGFYMLTHGLREHGEHAEIEVCNVPGAYVRATMQMLNGLADYILNDGGRFAHGETMQLSSEPFAAIGFRTIAPGESGTDHDLEVLRVHFLA